VVATGPYIGEGFDCPALDTLFLAAPVGYKGSIVQWAGRILRARPGKTTAQIHDYHDVRSPVLAASLARRAPRGTPTSASPTPAGPVLRHLQMPNAAGPSAQARPR
jgi:superfamily II DNA or RNA helicase